ncbi:MAG: hypothetical protein AAF944_05340 [Bacteroidota bacterium]
MKITDELITRYLSNQCTEEERRFVQEWLTSNEYDTSALTDDELDELGKSTWEAIEKSNYESFKQADAAPQLTDGQATKTISLPKKLTRYAAAACFIIGVFAAGLLTGFTFAKPSTDTEKQARQLTDLPGLLHIYGGNGTYGVVMEDRYRVAFKGKLKLYNEAQYPKQIVCGKQEFTLEPRRTYYLSGSHHQASLVISEDWEMDTYWGIDIYREEQPELVGDFSFLQLD